MQNYFETNSSILPSLDFTLKIHIQTFTLFIYHSFRKKIKSSIYKVYTNNKSIRPGIQNTHSDFIFFSLFLIYITEKILFVTKDKSNFIVFVAGNIRVTLLYDRNSILCLLRKETWIDLFFLLSESNCFYIIFWIMLITIR